MGKKILIVEDEFIVANDLRLILERTGYKVNGIAESVDEAEEQLQKCKPDLAILDIRLKGKLSGIDFARKLKAENIAFIYLSANSNQQILENAKTTEPYGFIVKPFREKDLLVTLDIAWYLHTHSLESKLRREERLQKQLAEISDETLNVRQKLLKLAGVIQSYIPFDFITHGIRPPDAENLADHGYLRTGFDEYQFIGENELRTITALTKTDLSLIIKNSPAENNSRIFSNDATNRKPENLNLTELVMDHFQLESGLVFPVAMGYGLSVDYFFYNRKPNIYNKEHITLLERLKRILEELAEQSIQEGISALPGKTAAVNPPHKPGIRTTNQAGPRSIVGTHHLLLSALDLALQVAPYNTSVLILGESGTGKEKVAHYIHANSSRRNGPFVNVNCAAIPATLVESELFGHEKGSFTGAVEKRKGKFELAEGGTIFLDEIGELPIDMQVKLLRVLQEKEIEYVGGSSSIKVNVRIIAATNRNLEKEVAEGNFRLDLYYRLSVFPITLPPLRERKSDLDILTLFFANKFCTEFNKPFTGISESMRTEILAYDWPGNIRELENVLEQSIILNDGKSKLELKRSLISTGSPSGEKSIENLGDVKQIQSETERAYLISILKKTNGRIRGTNGAAYLLNIKPTTLASKIARLNINRAEFISR
ncbi:MAG: sigma 54-interacting response regulator [Chitinophagaceae bacterium]